MVGTSDGGNGLFCFYPKQVLVLSMGGGEGGTHYHHAWLWSYAIDSRIPARPGRSKVGVLANRHRQTLLACTGPTKRREVFGEPRVDERVLRFCRGSLFRSQLLSSMIAIVDVIE